MLKLNSKKFLTLLMALLLFIGPFFTREIHASSSGYTIDKYHIDIIVNEDNSFDITEHITANFEVPKHGIIRTIPLKNEIIRNDGSTGTNRAKISEIRVNEEYDVSYESGNAVIKIGDADRYVDGDVEYIICYTYSLNKDTLKNADEFYFNIIGTEWDTSISNITFNIKMPKEFDSSKLGFSVGKAGAIGYSNLEFNVNNTIITGQYLDTLPAYNGLTVRLELPDKYFKYNIFKQIMNFITDYLGTILIFIAYLLVFLKCKKIIKEKKNVVKPVEFYPPNNLKSIDLKFIYNKYFLQYENASMLIELASNGYITISETNSKYNYILTKIKEYEGTDVRYQLLMKDLFKTSDSVETKNKHVSNAVLTKIYNVTTKYNKKYFRKQKISPTLFAFLPFITSIISGLILKRLDGIATFLTFVSFIIPTFVIRIIGNERNDEGLTLYGRILGFKSFIETAEKERLQMLVEQNPQYFYDLLPYAYVLGVSDVWIKNFETIMMPAPEWYHGNFNAGYFMTSMNRSFSNISTGKSSSSGGSGFSGGGSSGGGSGGGGGSSW